MRGFTTSALAICAMLAACAGTRHDYVAPPPPPQAALLSTAEVVNRRVDTPENVKELWVLTKIGAQKLVLSGKFATDTATIKQLGKEPLASALRVLQLTNDAKLIEEQIDNLQGSALSTFPNLEEMHINGRKFFFEDHKE